MREPDEKLRLIRGDAGQVGYRKTDVGPFPTAYRGISTSWFKLHGKPAVQYLTSMGVFAQIVEQDDHGIKSYDVSWSGQPHEMRTIYDLDEAVAFALWLIK